MRYMQSPKQERVFKAGDQHRPLSVMVQEISLARVHTLCDAY